MKLTYVVMICHTQANGNGVAIPAACQSKSLIRACALASNMAKSLPATITVEVYDRDKVESLQVYRGKL